MSHGPAGCSRYTFLNGFGEGTGRTQSRGVRCESCSQCNFAPQVGKIWSKMECMAGKRCRFPHAKLMISCLHRKLHKQVLVSDHWHQKVASWAPECKKYCVLYYFLHAQGGRMDGFGGPWGGRVTIVPPGNLRFCKENECLLCLRGGLGGEVGVI